MNLSTFLKSKVGKPSLKLDYGAAGKLLSSLTGINFLGSVIGSLDGVVFKVSSPKNVMTLDGFSRSAKARLATHTVIAEKPLTEFLGPDMQTLSFSIKLNAYRGVNPRKEMDKLFEYCEKGRVCTFVLGGKPVGKGKWLIESVKEGVDLFDFDGSVLASTADLTLREYVQSKGAWDA